MRDLPRTYHCQVLGSHPFFEQLEHRGDLGAGIGEAGPRVS